MPTRPRPPPLLASASARRTRSSRHKCGVGIILPVGRVLPRPFAPTGALLQGPVERDITQVEADHLVVGGKCLAHERLVHASRQPLVAAAPTRRGPARAG